MAGADPFGLQDGDRTQFHRPQPGGRRSAAAPSPAPAPPPGPSRAAPLPTGTPGRGPFVEAAFGLLQLAPLLRTGSPPASPEALREQAVRELARFVERARQAGADGRQVSLAHYALCALLDDVVLNTPWGAQGSWRAQSLAGTLHHDVAAGERFFDHLDQARADPERHRPVLELMAACLAMGFEGRYRLSPGGRTALARLREDLGRQLCTLGGGEPRELSPHWQGVGARHVPLSARVPLWVYGAGTLVLLAALYTGFALRLGYAGTTVDLVAATLPPAGPVEIVRDGGTPAPRLRVEGDLAASLRGCLPEGARGAADAVVEDLDKVRVRLPNTRLFASGRADLDEGVRPVLACMAGVLAGAGGQVMVLGHTDNVPLRGGRFADNWDLSRARAKAVAAVLTPTLPADRVAVDGRGEAEPVARNDTEEGRAANRRVEIVLLK